MEWLAKANTSEKHAVSIFRAEVAFHFSPEEGESMLLRNGGFYQPIRTRI
jgi:hypothetical protein